MADDMVLDRARGELRLLGRRQAAIDPQSLCDHLDSLVGAVVGEVIMNNLEFRLGTEDAARLRQVSPSATIEELVDKFEEVDLISGMGVTKTKLSNHPNDPITVEIWNPVARGVKGAAKSFLFSWWCGALTTILDREMEMRNVTYDEKANVMKCEIVARLVR